MKIDITEMKTAEVEKLMREKPGHIESISGRSYLILDSSDDQLNIFGGDMEQEIEEVEEVKDQKKEEADFEVEFDMDQVIDKSLLP